MKNDHPASPGPKTALTTPNVKPPVPAPDSVPVIPSGYEINSVGLLTLEGEEPRPALVLEKSLVGVKFLVWNAPPKGGYYTIDAPWNHIRFEQSVPPKEGNLALLRMCVERACDGGYRYGSNMDSDRVGDAFFRLVKAYRSMLKPEEIVEDLIQHAFKSNTMLVWSKWIHTTSLSLKRTRELCTAPKGAAMAQKMMKYAMAHPSGGSRVLLEIWMANARLLYGQRYKIAETIARNLTWDEIKFFLCRFTDAGTFVGWSDTWMRAAAKMVGKQRDKNKELDLKARLISALRASEICATREEWLRLPSLKEVARVWSLTPEDFLDQYILNR